jgi:hypothetical protein
MMANEQVANAQVMEESSIMTKTNMQQSLGSGYKHIFVC